MKLALQVLGSILLAALGWAAVQVGLLAREAKRDLGGLTSQLSTTLAQINSTERITSDKLGTEQRQIQEATVALKHTIELTNQKLFGRDLKSGIFGQVEATIRGVNDGLIPQLSATIQSTNSLSQQIGADLTATTNGLQPILANLAVASKGAADSMADPAILSALHHIDATAANVETSTGYLAGTTKDVEDMADAARKAYLKPVSWWWALVKDVLPPGADIAVAVAQARSK